MESGISTAQPIACAKLSLTSSAGDPVPVWIVAFIKSVSVKSRNGGQNQRRSAGDRQPERATKRAGLKNFKTSG